MAMSTITIAVYGLVGIFVMIFAISAGRQYMKNKRNGYTQNGDNKMELTREELIEKKKELKEKKELVILNKELQQLQREIEGDAEETNPLKKGAKDTWRAWKKVSDGTMKGLDKLRDAGDWAAGATGQNSKGRKNDPMNLGSNSGGIELDGAKFDSGLDNDIGFSGGVELDRIDMKKPQKKRKKKKS